VKERWAALKLVETELNKEFGSTTSIVRLGNKVGLPLPSIDTGFPSVNYDVIQCGGIPRGRIIEILGPESS
jgi:RecA/RadA recombinase